MAERDVSRLQLRLRDVKDTELRQERDKAVYEVYLRGLRTMEFTSMHDAVEWVRAQPAPKFYISPKALVNYIGAILHKSKVPPMHRSTGEKIDRLYNMYLDYMKANPKSTLPRERICEILVDEPAPRFYIGHDMTIKIIQRERNRHAAEIQRRFLR